MLFQKWLFDLLKSIFNRYDCERVILVFCRIEDSVGQCCVAAVLRQRLVDRLDQANAPVMIQVG